MDRLRTLLPGWMILRFGGWESLEDIFRQHGGLENTPSIVEVTDFNWGWGDAAYLWKALNIAAHQRVNTASNTISKLFDDLSFMSCTQLRLGKSLAFSAEVWSENHSMFKRTKSGNQGSISFGATLALDDIACSVASESGFMSGVKHGMPAAWVPIADLGVQFSQRYRDYRPARKVRSSQLIGYISRQLPIQVGRVGLAICISELSLLWIAAHEAAHVALGHFDVLPKFGMTSMRIGDGSAAPVFSAHTAQDIQDLQCLEMQADWLATIVLLTWVSDDPENEIYAFAILDEIRKNDPDKDRLDKFDANSYLDRVHIAVLFAASALISLEHGRLQSASEASDHPIPSSRVLNLLVSAYTFLEMVFAEHSSDGTGRHQRENLENRIGKIAIDIELIAHNIGVSNSVYQYRDNNSDSIVLFEDVKAVIEGRNKNQIPLTAAGHIYATMVSRSRNFGLDPSGAFDRARELG